MNLESIFWKRLLDKPQKMIRFMLKHTHINDLVMGYEK